MSCKQMSPRSSMLRPRGNHHEFFAHHLALPRRRPGHHHPAGPRRRPWPLGRAGHDRGGRPPQRAAGAAMECPLRGELLRLFVQFQHQQRQL
ncbi:hypothetical protein Hsero_3208 [Herbaspirillum seropedicae SmR1]|uniref:Uncharacterized protein n=1 Tax=Herbaspirillum seropedicae (strain SmR1) TaxID=757424 RepID=D8J1C1_HERSS|nr:hypothetical protein Hsero_3208 [Herbaspirillum seropedicae SmR1]